MEKSEKKPMRFSFRRRPKSVSVDRSEAHAADVSIGQYLEKLNYVRYGRVEVGFTAGTRSMPGSHTRGMLREVISALCIFRASKLPSSENLNISFFGV